MEKLALPSHELEQMLHGRARPKGVNLEELAPLLTACNFWGEWYGRDGPKGHGKERERRETGCIRGGSTPSWSLARQMLPSQYVQAMEDHGVSEMRY